MNYVLTKKQLSGNYLRVPILDEVFEKIREALKQKGYSQKKLAEGLNVSEPTISRIMKQKRGLSVETLLKIAEILDISPASLLPGENPDTKIEFEEYIRNIIREELEKALKKK